MAFRSEQSVDLVVKSRVQPTENNCFFPYQLWMISDAFPHSHECNSQIFSRHFQVIKRLLVVQDKAQGEAVNE